MAATARITAAGPVARVIKAKAIIPVAFMTSTRLTTASVIWLLVRQWVPSMGHLEHWWARSVVPFPADALKEVKGTATEAGRVEATAVLAPVAQKPAVHVHGSRLKLTF